MTYQPPPPPGKKQTLFVSRKIINFESKFKEKLLCDGPTFTAGDACKYSCAFCYTPSIGVTRNDIPEGLRHQDVVIRRKDAVQRVRSQLLTAKGLPKFTDPSDQRVIYGSPLVDVAADSELAEETIAICLEILKLTHWQIRLLSKSSFLPRIARALKDHKARMIYGVSTGTIDDPLARAFEQGTPLPSKRIASLHQLQDEGYRTFGMICPSLPRFERDYTAFSEEVCAQLRIQYCEHVWAEVINVRGESLINTTAALRQAGFRKEANTLEEVSLDQTAWEEYNQDTFLGHWNTIPMDQLRYLTYVTKKTRPWWEQYQTSGAVLL